MDYNYLQQHWAKDHLVFRHVNLFDGCEQESLEERRRLQEVCGTPQRDIAETTSRYAYTVKLSISCIYFKSKISTQR